MEAHTRTISRFQNPHRTSYPSPTPSSSITLYPKSVSFKSNHMFSLFSNSSLPKIRFFSINSSLKLEAVNGDAKEKFAKKKLAVFVSGGGSNFKSIHQSAIHGSINGEIVVLVTNKPDCGGAEYARSNNIPIIEFPKKKQNSENLFVNDLITTLRRHEVDFILLAGYLKLIPDELVRAYPKSILNIHPSLLPAFGGKGYYGMKVHQAVIASGARYSGPTIHFVDEHYDTGRILAQRVVPVHATDTAADLAARVLQKEHELYVEVVAALCDERIAWREDGVPLIQSKEKPDVYN